MYKKIAPQHLRSHKQAGFTIVELMIATTVFSVILVTITVGVMYFTHSYYKGVYSGMTQNVARDISDSVAQAVQFGTGDPTVVTVDPTQSYFCAGGYVFVFKQGQQYDQDHPGATIGMYMQPMDGDCGHSATVVTSPRRQLLGDRMRVTFLRFEKVDGLYKLDIKVAYGDDDLLQGTDADVQCNIGTGSEYCAVARYTTSVSQRKT